MTYIKGHKLFANTYLCEFDDCLVLANTNDKGEIIKMVTFGQKEGEKENVSIESKIKDNIRIY